MKNWLRLNLFDKAFIYFLLVLNLVILIFKGNLNNWGFYFGMHFVDIAAILILVPYAQKQEGPVWHFLRYWYVLIVFPILYWDMGHYLHMIIAGEQDHYILALEKSIFGVLPNLWVQKLVNPVLTEIMQLSYAVYWFTIPGSAAVCYFSKRYRVFEYLILSLSITFFISYLLFVLFPVAGPRFTLASQITAAYKGLLVTPFLRSFVASAGLRGGAFPSSHVAVAVTGLLFMWRYFPKIGKRYFLPAVIALSLATVYGQYHYVTDVFAGLLIGIFSGFTGIYWCDRKLRTVRETVA